jgi:putative transposase
MIDRTHRLSDNVFVETLCRSVEYKRAYLSAFERVSVAYKDIAQYKDWYNGECPHSSLNDRTPTEIWLESLLPLKEAA